MSKDQYESELQEFIKWNKEQELQHSFFPRATEIQEALKPLGYVVEGFRLITQGKFEVHLFRESHFTSRTSLLNENNAVERDHSDGANKSIPIIEPGENVSEPSK